MLNRLLERIAARREGRHLSPEEYRVKGEVVWRESTNIRLEHGADG